MVAMVVSVLSDYLNWSQLQCLLHGTRTTGYIWLPDFFGFTGNVMITMMLYEHTDSDVDDDDDDDDAGDDDAAAADADADADGAHGQVDEAEVVSINSWLFLFRG